MSSFEDYLIVRGAFMSDVFEIYDIKDGLAAKIFCFMITESIIYCLSALVCSPGLRDVCPV